MGLGLYVSESEGDVTTSIDIPPAFAVILARAAVSFLLAFLAEDLATRPLITLSPPKAAVEVEHRPIAVFIRRLLLMIPSPAVATAIEAVRATEFFSQRFWIDVLAS